MKDDHNIEEKELQNSLKLSSKCKVVPVYYKNYHYHTQPLINIISLLRFLLLELLTIRELIR